MDVIMLGSSGKNAGTRQYATTYLLNQAVAIDAGCLGFHSSPQQQASVGHLFLTHAHADHIATLPFFLENVWTPAAECPIVYGSAQTLATLRRSVFNGEVWPDFVAMSERMAPFLRLQPLQPGVCVMAGGLSVTPVEVNHSAGAFGYIVRGAGAAVIFGGDSGPTTRLWQLAAETAGLRAIFLEASFPNRMAAIAEASLHLTSAMFCREAAKAPPGARIIAVHLKAAYRDEIARELTELGIPQMEIGECDREYRF